MYWPTDAEIIYDEVRKSFHSIMKLIDFYLWTPQKYTHANVRMNSKNIPRFVSLFTCRLIYKQVQSWINTVQMFVKKTLFGT